jgi:hypothetical protein
MKELKFYVYVYCNPLKSVNYCYTENGIGIDFDYEPFYIGKGCNTRVLTHLKESKKYQEIIEKENHKYNKHKINTINKIHREGKEVIIYKICENLDEEVAYLLERFFIKLIGRSDKNLGPLTNLTDGGEGVKNISEKSLKIRVDRRLLTLQSNPYILINSGIKISNTKNLKSEEEKQQITKKYKNTLQDNPEIVIQKVNNFKKTITDNPNIIINKEINRQNTLKKNPDILRNAINKGMKTKINNPEIMKEASKKANKTKIIRKSTMGRKSCKYKKLNVEFLLYHYFNKISFVELKNLYNITYNEFPNLDKFLALYSFPRNCLSNMCGFKKVNKYLKFVEENKHKIQWYIDNYERLEEEYYDKKWKKKYSSND